MRLGILPGPHAHPRARSWPRRRAAVACSAALIMAGVAACGSAGDPAGPGAVAACAPSWLKMTVDASAAGSAAGSTYYPIDFSNVSATRCRLDGYPAAWFGTAAGQRIGAAAAWDSQARTRPVILPPGATAHSWLQVTDAANYPARKCHPVTARMLFVSAPGVAAARRIRHAFLTCARAIPGHDILRVQPVLPGPGNRGTA